VGRLARFVIAHRWWVLATWLILAVAGGFAAPRAVSALSYSFGLLGQPGYATNQQVVAATGSGGVNPPVLLLVGDGAQPVPDAAAAPVTDAVGRVTPGARVVSFAQQPALRSADGRTAVVLVYPPVTPGPDPYVAALPALEQAAAQLSSTGVPVTVTVTVTGVDALAAGGGGGGAGVLAETLFGGVGALVVLVVVCGSFLALTPLLVAAGSILTTFLIVWGLTGLTEVSFIVQYLLSLIGLDVAIDYALLVVTRWREELGQGADNPTAVTRAMSTAGRSVLFSGVTVAVSLAALPVPFLRSVGFTGLLIPLLSVAAALTLLPALLLVAGPRLSWPHRRSTDPESRLWRRVGTTVVAHRWAATAASVLLLLALGAPTNTSLASTGGPAAAAITRLDTSGVGAGLSNPVEILTTDPEQARQAVTGIDGVAAVIAPPTWRAGGGRTVVEAWTVADTSSPTGSDAAAAIRSAAENTGAQVGGTAAQNPDFITAVYGNAWWIALIIIVVTVALLARALRSVVLPIKALLLNLISTALPTASPC
jgi:RND superfamily putative drug exporter